MSYKWPSKSQSELLDYSFDWQRVLKSDETIEESIWSADEGITISYDAIDGKITTVWIGGGQPGQTYQFTNTVTTTQGRTYERQASIRINTR